MRVYENTVRDIRRKVFTEVCRLAYECDGDFSAIEDLPYRIIPGEVARYRDSIFLERAIVGERVRLAIGLPLRPVTEHAPLSMGIEASAVAKKYYDPPLINIIKFACNACPDRFFVTDGCQGCLAHPCVEVCPKQAISLIKGRAYIDQDKCIKCGRCTPVCSYNAIIRQKRPCSEACGVDAIGSDVNGKADIDQNKCVSCGMCVVNCPFGAISDKGQMFQLIQAMKKGDKVMAIIAPAVVGQFGPKVTMEKMVGALKALGFWNVAEVAVGADLCTLEEAQDFVRDVPSKQPFMGTSCCPSWSVMAKREFPEVADCISMALTPMVLTARLHKERHPTHKIVFIGPCSAKKLEASRKAVKSYVDFVLTFEELLGMFDAKGIDPAHAEPSQLTYDSTSAGRGFPVGGGVAQAVKDVIAKTHPELEVKTKCARGLRECYEMVRDAAAGKYDGYLLEGMACPGGCIAGTGTIADPKKSAVLIARYQSQTHEQNALDSKYESGLALLRQFRHEEEGLS